METKTKTTKKWELNAIIVIALVLLIPIGTVISNAVHWKPATALAVSSNPAAVPSGGVPVLKKGDVKVFPEKSEAVPKKRQKIQHTDDGNVMKETYNDKGQRVSKIIFTPSGDLLSRWDFEPNRERIIRYEVNEYKDSKFVQRRVAKWKYAGEGGFVKTNQFFDAKGKPSNSFVESINVNEIKYKEQWFDEQKRLTAEKLWNPATGVFESYFTNEYGLGGWATRTYLDEKGNGLREVLLTPGGKIFNAGVIQIGRKS